jgi:hypothetical protein
MGGWMTLTGEMVGIEGRLARFRRIFSVEGVPGLRTEIISPAPGFSVLLWAWNTDHVPDVCVESQGNQTVVLCGAVTGLDETRIIEMRPEMTAKRILSLWIERGERLIPDLNGSFSLIFYNYLTREYRAVTDRFASQSIWMVKDGKIWLVGNYPSALAAAMEASPEIDPAGLWALLHYGRRVDRRGLLFPILNLLAGEIVNIAPDKTSYTHSWHRRRYEPKESVSPYEWGKEISSVLRQSARRYRQVMTNPHLFLSGGLDSRIAAAAFGEPLKAITLCTQPNAESRIAGHVAKTLRLDHQIMKRSPYWNLETSDAAALVSAGNHLNHHAHFIKPVSRIGETISEAEFLLGDLLENFNKNYFKIPQDEILRFNPETLATDLSSWLPSTVKNPNRLGIHLRSEIRVLCQERYARALNEFYRKVMSVSDDPADQLDTLLRWADVSVTYTYNMLTCIRTLASERNIAFDNDVHDVLLHLPSKLKRKGKIHSWTLFHLNPELSLIPDSNYFLPPLFPEELKNLAKKIRPFLGRMRRGLARQRGDAPVLQTSGSWLLLHEMYRKDPCYRSNIEATLSDSRLLPDDVFDRRQIQLTWSDYLAGRLEFHIELEALLSFARLMRLLPISISLKLK